MKLPKGRKLQTKASKAANIGPVIYREALGTTPNSKSKHYPATKMDVSNLVRYIKTNHPDLAVQLGNRLREYAAERLTYFGPPFAAAGLSYLGQKTREWWVGPSSYDTNPLPPGPIGNPLRRIPGAGGDKSNTVFKQVANTTYALSSAPNPKPISLNSGIKPNTYVNDYMTPVEGVCSPLHLSTCYLTLPVAPNNPLTSYFTSTICFDIQTRAQELVGFSVDISSTLSSSNLVGAYNAVITALQCYFYYSSILSYESDSKNKNSGMIALRALIDPTILSDVRQLGKRLEDTPVPPRLVEWVRYMSGTYLSGNTQGSPLLKIVPNFSYFNGVAPSPSNAAVALAALNSYNPLFALLRRCIPAWRIGKLYDIPVTPTYDQNFLTIFANLPTMNRSSGANVSSVTVPNAQTAITYNSFTNKLDGLAFAMAGPADTALNFYYPGLVIPATTGAVNIDTRFSYYKVGANIAFYPVYSYPFLALSRTESVVTNGTTVMYLHPSGSDKCQNVTGSALLQSGQSTLDFLFNTDGIKTGKKVKQIS